MDKKHLPPRREEREEMKKSPQFETENEQHTQL
jgi:hypothetical protein